MKTTKKIFALLLAMVMVFGLGSAAFAADPPVDTDRHTITIKNTDQNVSHTYYAYKVFSGNLNADESTLSNIQWADGVNGANLLAALKASTDSNLLGDNPSTTEVETDWNIFTPCTTARDVAKVLADFSSTGQLDSPGKIDAVASIIANNLVAANKLGPFVETAAGKEYTLNVTGDGYYFIKDETTSLSNTSTGYSDTLSKYLLYVIKDTTIYAKDTGMNPNKYILEQLGLNTSQYTQVAADSKAIGDEVFFEVNITIPNTKKYIDHFVFVMNDQLPVGLTFFGLDSIKILDTDTDKTELEALPTANYTLTVTTGNDAFTTPTTAHACVTTTGGQTIKIVFNDFKAYAEADHDLNTDGVQDYIGKTISIKYKAVVNEKAVFGETGNKNEVSFQYSNDPNHPYNGDTPGNGDPIGTTPSSTTKTYVTTLKISKVDDEDKALAGATFTLVGTTLNHVLVTGEKYEKSPYPASGNTLPDGETIIAGTYYKLKDGSYTETVPGSTLPNGDIVNDTQYESTTDTYVKVSYVKEVVDTTPTTVTLTGTSDKDGIIKFEGLNEGEYTLTEIIAPDGFNMLTDPITIDIDWTDPTKSGVDQAIIDAGGFSIGQNSHQDVVMTTDGAEFSIKIENMPGSVLPSTGGIGTTIFYVVGGLMVLGAAIVLITKRRMSAEK